MKRKQSILFKNLIRDTGYIQKKTHKHESGDNKRFKILIVIVLSFFIKLGLVSADGSGVEFFSPQGAVKGVRQVNVRFSEQMVSFGDPFVQEPFDIKCPEKSYGRWMDGKNWEYDFDRDLPVRTQ